MHYIIERGIITAPFKGVMCMQKLEQYLHSMFGTNTFLREYCDSGDLPMYLTDHYQMFQLRIGADAYILVRPKEPIKINTSVLKKQMYQIQRYTNLMPILAIDSLRLSQRNALIQSGIAFVVPEKQLYIPQFVMNLTETEAAIEAYGEQFAVATQVVFSYLLLNQIKETNAHQLNETLHYSVAAINRALKELCYRELLHTVGNGTRKQYTIPNGTEFWERGKVFLFNPVKSRRYVTVDFKHNGFLMSNDLALSHLSFLNGGQIHYYASSAQDFKKIDKVCFLNEYDTFDDNYAVIEIFRYDPKLLANGNYIDIISLYAQFKGTMDERVQIEIESLVNKILW